MTPRRRTAAPFSRAPRMFCLDGERCHHWEGVRPHLTEWVGRFRKRYPHAAGHPIGRQVHDIGPILGAGGPERYGSTAFLRLEAGQVLAVEPLL